MPTSTTKAAGRGSSKPTTRTYSQMLQEDRGTDMMVQALSEAREARQAAARQPATEPNATR